MSRSWHVVNLLKEKGPLTQFQLWNNLKSTPSFRSRTGLKVILNNLRHRHRLVAMPVEDNINNTKEHLYMVTAKPANFIPRSLSVSQLEKKKVAGQELKAFFKEVNAAEQTLRDQYNLSHPEAAARQKQMADFRLKFQKGGITARKKQRKTQRLEKEQQEEAKEMKLAEAKHSLQLTRSGRVHVKAQDTPHKKRIALEINRIAGARKRIVQIQQGLVKKGLLKAQKTGTRVGKLNKAGRIGTPERRLEAERLRKEDEKHAKRMSKWKKTRAQSDARRAALLAQNKPVQEINVAQVLSAASSPSTLLRDVAKQKLATQRSLEKQPQTKKKGQTKVKNVQNKAATQAQKS